MLNIYKHSHFIADAFGHGGNKRTAQINDLLMQAGITAKQADLNYATVKGSKLSHYLTGFQKNRAAGTGNKSRYAIGRYTALIEQFIAEQKPQLFIWESTVGYNLLLAEIFHKHNIPVIALPHNLESMVTGNKSVFSKKLSPHWLFEELDYLKFCKKVFTISQEEQWLLANYGIDASYLPYHPPHEVESFLLDLRQKREEVAGVVQNNHQNVLLLGTFHNPPTVSGFSELLVHIKQIKGLNINIAGFGSEKFAEQFSGDRVKVWGSVSNQTLADLIIQTNCAIIHQQPSGGALTRIPELLIAGVPVIANTHAARSCYHKPGLSVYDSYDELNQILSNRSYTTPPVVDKPKEEKAFIDFIKTLIKVNETRKNHIPRQ